MGGPKANIVFGVTILRVNKHVSLHYGKYSGGCCKIGIPKRRGRMRKRLHVPLNVTIPPDESRVIVISYRCKRLNIRPSRAFTYVASKNRHFGFLKYTRLPFRVIQIPELPIFRGLSHLKMHRCGIPRAISL